MGKEVVPLARSRYDDAGTLLDRALWHAVLIHFGDEIDHKLLGQLLIQGEPGSKYMAKLILRVANITDVDEKFPELKYVDCRPFDGCALK